MNLLNSVSFFLPPFSVGHENTTENSDSQVSKHVRERADHAQTRHVLPLLVFLGASEDAFFAGWLTMGGSGLLGCGGRDGECGDDLGTWGTTYLGERGCARGGEVRSEGGGG